MFTAKVKGKSFNNGVIAINVEFTNGEFSNVEEIIPQDDMVFKVWVKERINFYNNSLKLQTELVENTVIDYDDNEVIDTPLTPSDVLRNEWLYDFHLYIRVLNTLVYGDIVKNSDTVVVDLKNKLKDNFLPNYINFI